MPGQDRECPIELLGEHGSGEFMGEGERGKGKFLRCPAAEGFRKTIGGTAEKDNFASAAVTRFAKPSCELRRRLRLPRVVEQNDGRGGVKSELAEGGGGIFAQFGQLDIGESADPRHVIVDHRPEFGTARFSEHDEMNFHGRMKNCSTVE